MRGHLHLFKFPNTVDEPSGILQRVSDNDPLSIHCGSFLAPEDELNIVDLLLRRFLRILRVELLF